LEKQAVRSKPSITKVASLANSKLFDWEKLLEYTHGNHVAIHSVLSKCKYVLEGNILTIYTGNKFYKNKLDDPKYAPLLATSLEALGVYELDIHTIPTARPPKDSQAATAFAILGGGEEVSVEGNGD
jgi:hypothetical protein